MEFKISDLPLQFENIAMRVGIDITKMLFIKINGGIL